MYMIILAILILILLVLSFTENREGAVSHERSNIWTGKEDILIGIGRDYKLYKFAHTQQTS